MDVRIEPQVLVCNRCRFGCVLTIAYDERAQPTSIGGNTCDRGYEYAQEESQHPTARISGTQKVAGCTDPASVRSATPIDSDHLLAALEELRAYQVDLPVYDGEVLVSNVANSGVDIVSRVNLP